MFADTSCDAPPCIIRFIAGGRLNGYALLCTLHNAVVFTSLQSLSLSCILRRIFVWKIRQLVFRIFSCIKFVSNRYLEYYKVKDKFFPNSYVIVSLTFHIARLVRRFTDQI